MSLDRETRPSFPPDHRLRSRRSGGLTLGVAVGLVGTSMALIGVVAFVAGILFTARAVATNRPIFAPSPGRATSWSPIAPALATEPMVVGAIHVMDVDPDAKRTFHQQLADEYRRAASAHQTVVVMTSARWCSVCKEIDAALSDARMQAALRNVDLVRVDIDDFDDELRAGDMFEDSLPWFYKVDSSLHPMDAISAGEWDENVPENMAPVLKSFLAGTLRARRSPSAMGTTL